MSRTTLTAFALNGLCAAIILYIITKAPLFGLVGAACYAVFLVVGIHYLRLRERYLIGLCIVSALIAVAVVAQPMPLLAEASIRAAYLSGFFLVLSVLRDGAMTSSSVVEVGRFLTQQPPTRRYWALALGGHTMGVVMNFGALILLAPLVQRGAKANSDTLSPQIVQIREQRQLMALSRGFSWFIAWAPTSIAQVVAVTVVSGASTLTVSIMGAIAAACVIVAGWIEDLMFGARLRKRLGGQRSPALNPIFPGPAFARLGGVYLLLTALSFYFVWLLETPLVNGIILSVVPVTALWIVLQMRAGRGDGRGLLTRSKDIAIFALPMNSPEASTLALAGFTGTVLAAVIPPDALDAIFSVFGTHVSLLYMSITATVVVFSVIAMPPMLTVTFIGGAASRAEGIGLEPDLLALALILGWAVNLTGSPFGGTNLILSRQTGFSVKKLAFNWNLRFSVMAFMVCCGVLLAASSV